MKIEIAETGRMTQSGSSLLKLIQNENMPVIDLLVRESLQNSLDARKSTSRYVDVEYLTGSFDSYRLSGELEGITEPLRKKYPASSYSYIAVRDSNTVGLTGELDYKKVRNNEYGNLIKLIYEICKPQEAEGAGGSWGLGKTVYFRVGIGLVVYYSRIKDENGQYAVRLAASLVENENSSDSMIPVYMEQSKRGIAWWGECIGENITQPITDEAIVNKFLTIFNISPYTGEETGTTIIIPYIDNEKLLLNNRVEYVNEKDEPYTPFWCHTIEDYLKIAIQRWYAPRLNNPNYGNGAFLRAKINGAGLSKDSMEPVFQVIQALYNKACFVEEDSILTEAGIEIGRDDINVLKYLDNKTVGRFAYVKVSGDILGTKYPDNKPNPAIYFNREQSDKHNNKPFVCFTRKPGMIVSYENSAPWVNNASSTAKDEFILGIYVLASSNQLKDRPGNNSLEEYVRKSEMADHTSWKDWSDGKYNPRIITKIQNGVNKVMNAAFGQETPDAPPQENSGLGKKYGDMLLPPDGFGKMPNPKPNPNPKPSNGGNRSFLIEASGITYSTDYMEVPVVVSSTPKNILLQSTVAVVIDSEAGKISLSEWLSMGLTTPFTINRVAIEVIGKEGKRISSAGVMADTEAGACSVEGLVFEKNFSKTGSLWDSVRIISDQCDSYKVRLVIGLKLNAKNVKPNFMFEKER